MYDPKTGKDTSPGWHKPHLPKAPTNKSTPSPTLTRKTSAAVLHDIHTRMKEGAPKQMRAKFPGVCSMCHHPIAVGVRITWDPQSSDVQHVDCYPPKWLASELHVN